MRYMLVIWRIQRPERRRMRDQAAAASAANTANANATTATTATNATNTNNTTNSNEGAAETMPGGLPLPVTAARPTQNNNSDSPRSDMQAIYGRFYWMLILYSSAKLDDSHECRMLVLLLDSTNSKECDSRLKAWAKPMVSPGLAQPIYFFACPGNLMGHEPTPWVWGLVLWVALQVGVLLLQDWLGPRFFVPKKYLPPVYDYHPILPTGDEESGRTAPTRHAQHDCAICLLPIDTASQTGGATRLSSVVGSLGRLNYMLTPCGHLFHTDCLERVSSLLAEYVV
ncbi:hypothetical protein BGZ76_010278 [Entomortierella beljakovae]|nr:hypothetical protein BGZ76_010278 [Entomortierella beljakovae]